MGGAMGGAMGDAICGNGDDDNGGMPDGAGGGMVPGGRGRGAAVGGPGGASLGTAWATGGAIMGGVTFGALRCGAESAASAGAAALSVGRLPRAAGGAEASIKLPAALSIPTGGGEATTAEAPSPSISAPLAASSTPMIKSPM